MCRKKEHGSPDTNVSGLPLMHWKIFVHRENNYF